MLLTQPRHSRARGFPYSIPNSSADNNASWFALRNLFLQSLIANNAPSTQWFYGAPKHSILPRMRYDLSEHFA